MKVKKILAAFLAAAMVLSTMTFTVFAETETISGQTITETIGIFGDTKYEDCTIDIDAEQWGIYVNSCAVGEETDNDCTVEFVNSTVNITANGHNAIFNEGKYRYNLVLDNTVMTIKKAAKNGLNLADVTLKNGAKLVIENCATGVQTGSVTLEKDTEVSVKNITYHGLTNIVLEATDATINVENCGRLGLNLQSGSSFNGTTVVMKNVSTDGTYTQEEAMSKAFDEVEINDAAITVDEKNAESLKEYADFVASDDKGVLYTDLTEAIATEVDNDKITLLSDVELPAITISKDITIDLNGNTVTFLKGANTPSAWIAASNGNVVIENGTLDITGVVSSCAVFGTGVYSGDNQKIRFNNVTVVGDGYQSGYRVFYANRGPISINDSVIDLKNEQASAGGVFGSENTYPIDITGTEINLDNTKRGFVNVEVDIEDSTLDMKNSEKTAFRNATGTITNTNVTVENYEYAVEDDADNGKLEITGENSVVTFRNNTAADIYIAKESEIVVSDKATLTANLIDDATANKVKADETATVILRTDEIEVAFEKVTGEGILDNSLYNIVLRADTAKEINRLTAADLTFEFVQTEGRNGTQMSYEIVKPADKNIEINEVTANRYEFHFDGENGADDTAESIVIAQVRFGGYGKFTFKVANAEENVVHATSLENNIVDSYIVNGDIDSGEGKLLLNNNVSDKDNDGSSDGTIEAIVAVPKHNLDIEVNFNNKLAADVTEAYQNMTVTISGGDVEDVLAIPLWAEGGKKATYSTKLTENTTYTVTLEGAGYRTARYTVKMTGDKKLVFWNNVQDDDTVTEYDKDADGNWAETGKKAKVNFLAGEIVKDNDINIYDLSAVVSYFGEDKIDEATDALKKSYVKYDLNRDGKINSKDVAYVLVSWGQKSRRETVKVSKPEDLAAAVKDATGPVKVEMGEGTYTLPNIGNKDITFTGTKDTVVDLKNNVGSTGADVTFAGVTVEFDNDGYEGFQHSNKVVYKDCVIKGVQFLYSDAEFINCTFEVEGDNYSVWTYGAKNVTFDNCTFNCDGKAVLIYTEGETHAAVTFNDCVFNDNNGDPDVSGKAAIEIGSSPYSTATTYKIAANNCTVNGFEKNNSTSALWGNKNSMDTDHLDVIIDGIDVY